MNKTVKKILKISTVFILLSLLLFEWYRTFVDFYNFRQLSKVKNILKDIEKWDKQFFYLEEFNDQYKAWIQPVKNCYYLRNYKSQDRVLYTFWFKLESYVYAYIYWTQYYAYPKYDIPYWQQCVWWIWCYDRNRESFEYIISNPCEE
jgi:hypothetical protein